MPADRQPGLTPSHFLKPISGRGNLPTRRLGDLVEALTKPIARVLRLKCLDENGQLRPESNCARRKARLNQISRVGGRARWR